tara:strand:- start:952 stop:1830 length:879 start_codon:yes stop_codon:yes gene_type:complete
MFEVSSEELLLWIKNNLNKLEEDSDKDSLYLLIDLLGGIPRSEINSLRINPPEVINMRVSLDSLNKNWTEFIKNKKPIQYLSNSCYWRDLNLEVNKYVLIPRVETEQVTEIILNLISDSTKELLITDLGTGSGAIAISLALKSTLWKVLATDIEQKAINLASKNFKKYSNANNLELFCGSWWKPLKKYAGKIDIAISNPPYIPLEVYKNLSITVKNFEPQRALNGGKDGFLHIREIIKEAPKYLKRGGWLLLENHFDQAEEVKTLMLNNGFESIEIIKDLYGIGRFTLGRYK